MKTGFEPAEATPWAEAVWGGLLVVVLLGAFPPTAAGQTSGTAALGGRLFFGAAREGYGAGEGTLSLEVRRALSWDGGSQRLAGALALRLDPGDPSRNLLDVHRLVWTWRAPRWEALAGVEQVRWGAVESVSLVDHVNQVDLPGGPSPERLGQPLAGVRLFGRMGQLEALVLPLFRERSFAGRGGGLWSSLPVDEAAVSSGPSPGRGTLDVAVRWSHAPGAWDLALAHFAGRSREPRFQPVGGETEHEQTALLPRYGQVARTSAETRWTRGSWILKGEAVLRREDHDASLGVAVGLEYAFADYLSVFAEYVRDGRGLEAPTSFQDDLFLGARLLTQDWTLSARGFVDRASGNVHVSAAGTRRLGDRITLALDGGWFGGDPGREPVHANRLDAFLALTLSYFF